jgi:oligosaccharide repeat unit polymerase
VLFPLLAIILSDMAQGGRVKIIIAGILFFSAYFLTRLLPASAKTFQSISKVRRLLAMALVLAVMLAAIEFVRSYRGVQERFYGASKELSSFENTAFITPSIYIYLSSHAGVFNAYWKAGGEQSFPGSNTFAPLFRILSRVDLVEYTPYFTKFYNIPISSNTGTYLRELHADFGVAGILTVPYLLGFLCTLVWFRIKRQATLTSVILLAHLYVIVAFSFFYQVTRLGQWAVSLITALLVCSFIDHRDYFRATIKGSLPPNP